MNQRTQIRLRQISKFNNCTLNNLPQIFQCSKCHKYNSVVENVTIKNCQFCNNPSYIKNKKI
jgi:hypothetical protein